MALRRRPRQLISNTIPQQEEPPNVLQNPCKRLAAGLVVALALTAAACGGDDDDSASSTTDTTAAPTTTPVA